VTTQTLLIRFLVCVLLAFLFGIARHRFGKPVGFGTFIFVTIGACGVAVTAVRLAPPPGSPLPLLSGIITGIGFLGAGALVRTGERITGFTSAATIWISAVFGMAVGVGEHEIAAIIYASMWVVLLVDHGLEKRGGGDAIILSVTIDRASRLSLSREIAASGVRPDLESTRFDRETDTVSLKYRLSGKPASVAALGRQLEQEDGVRSFQIE
jgi:putative Mg2+ transporter-C (MgtC) family protein